MLRQLIDTEIRRPTRGSRVGAAPADGKIVPGSPNTNDAVVTLKAVGRGVLDGRLTAADCRLLLCVRLTLALATTLVRRTTLPSARRVLAILGPMILAVRGAVPEARILWALAAAERRDVGRGRCLARALAADLLIDGTACPHEIVIGVTSPAPGLLKSHAWIERDGRVLIGGDKSIDRYSRLVAWPGGAR